MLTTATVKATCLVLSTFAMPPGSPAAGAQALLLRLLATLAALWATAPTAPLRLGAEQAMRLARPLLLDPRAVASCSAPADLPLLQAQLGHLLRALCWEARGLPGWTPLRQSLEQLERDLGAELGWNAAGPRGVC